MNETERVGSTRAYTRTQVEEYVRSVEDLRVHLEEAIAAAQARAARAADLSNRIDALERTVGAIIVLALAKESGGRSNVPDTISYLAAPSESIERSVGAMFVTALAHARSGGRAGGEERSNPGQGTQDLGLPLTWSENSVVVGDVSSAESPPEAPDGGREALVSTARYCSQVVGVAGEAAVFNGNEARQLLEEREKMSPGGGLTTTRLGWTWKASYV